MRYLKENGHFREDEVKNNLNRRKEIPNKKINKPREFGKEITNIYTALKAIDLDEHPKVTQASINLLEFYKQYNEKALNKLNDIDQKGFHNLYECSEYASEIFDYLRHREVPFITKFGFLKTQTEVNENIRGCIIDWIVDIHRKFKLNPETLYMTISIIDRVLGKEKIMKSKIQTLAIAALFIAGKYEEIYPPELKDYVTITNFQVGKDEILKMERQILKILEFDLSCPSIYRFIERYSKLLKADEKQFYLSQYLSELQFLDSRMLRFAPSLIALSCLYLSAKILKKECWNTLIEEQSKYTENEVKSCSNVLSGIAISADNQGISNIKNKYLNIKYQEVAKISIDI